MADFKCHIMSCWELVRYGELVQPIVCADAAERLVLGCSLLLTCSCLSESRLRHVPCHPSSWKLFRVSQFLDTFSYSLWMMSRNWSDPWDSSDVPFFNDSNTNGTVFVTDGPHQLAKDWWAISIWSILFGILILVAVGGNLIVIWIVLGTVGCNWFRFKTGVTIKLSLTALELSNGSWINHSKSYQIY